MKRFIAILLTLVMVASLAACDLFSDESVVKFEELYTHKDPDGLKYSVRKVLINKDFGPTIEEYASSMAYPDTMKYDEEGEMIGMYDYDPSTGIASGYTDLATGEFVAEEIDLGMPDESLLLALKGNVTVGSVVYGTDEKAVCAYLYIFLGDAADKDAVKSALETFYGLELTEESDTVLVNKKDEKAIDAQFTEWETLYGQIQSDRTADGYVANIQVEYGLKNYGVNPYKPCAGITDPEDIEFDEKVVLTSSGAYSFTDASLENDMICRTDVIYGFEGKTVAHYIYYEYKSKDAADKLIKAQDGNFYSEAVRVSDTVVCDVIVGTSLQETISAYIGYGVIADDTVDSYVTNIEGTYFAMVYEQ